MTNYVTINPDNVPAIIDALTAGLKQAQSMEAYYKERVDKLTAENSAQTEEIKRLQRDIDENATPRSENDNLQKAMDENAKAHRESLPHKYNVGDRVQAHGGMVGIVQAIDAAFSNFPYLVKWYNGEESWAGIYSLSPAPEPAQ